MIQEGVEIMVRRAAVLATEGGDFFGVGAVDGGDFDSGDGAGGASVSFRDVAATDEADVESHVTQRINDTPPRSLCRRLRWIQGWQWPR